MEPDRPSRSGLRPDEDVSLLRSIRTAMWIIVALLAVLVIVVYVGFDNVTSV